jgi:hypothetical protein
MLSEADFLVQSSSLQNTITAYFTVENVQAARYSKR